MKTNVGPTDRMIRILAGVAILAAGAYFKNWLGLSGLVPLVPGLVRHCPAYCVIGASTCKKDA